MSPIATSVVRALACAFAESLRDSGIRRSAASRCRRGTSHTACAAVGHVGVVGDRDHHLSAARREALADLVAAVRVERAERIVDQEQRAARRSRPPPPRRAPARRQSAAAHVSPCEPNGPGAQVADRQRRGRRGAAPPARSGGCSSSRRRSASRARNAPSRSASAPHVRGVRAGQPVAREMRRTPRDAVGARALDRLGARPDQRRARLDQLLVPRLDTRGHAGTVPLLQQAVALAQGAVVGGEQRLPCSGQSAVTASSRNVRRFDGSPITIGRSNGPNSTARTCRRRSRLRRTGERLTFTRLAPCVGISTSTSTAPVQRLELTARVRGVGALTHERRVRGRPAATPSAYRKYMPSSRLVLPSPFGPDRHDQPVGHRFDPRQARGCGSHAARPRRGASGEALRRRRLPS